MRTFTFICAVLAGTVFPAINLLPAFASAVDFNVVLTSQLDSKTAKVGQPVYARLVSDLRTGSKVLAPTGSKITGHVTDVFGSRRLLHSEISTKRWLRAGGGIGMQFDRIVPPHGAPLKINAHPLSIVAAGEKSGNGTDVNVSKQGTVEAARKRDLKPKLGRTALSVAAFVAGPVTSLAGAAIGAVRPSTVLPDATDGTAQKHRRLKGMTTGFVAGLPGGFLVNDAVLKGQSAVLKPGTQLKLEWVH